MIGKQLGNYELVEEIGRGGMGTVYKGIDKATDEFVAVKVLPPQLSRQPSFLLRFKREVSTLRQLTHPNIVQIKAVGDDEGINYYAMEYVEGVSLEKLIEKNGKVDPLRSIDIIVAVASALEFAHKKGIIHRDIKPANVLIDTKGTVKLTDFGIAKLLEATRMTESGGIVGTAEYMSPEQAEGRRINNRSDIYSLGILFYKMLTGRLPFKGNTALEILQQHRFALPTSVKELNTAVPNALANVVERMIEKDPEKRFTSMGMVIKVLETIKEKIATPDRLARKYGKKPVSVMEGERAWRVFLIILGVVGLGLIIFFVMWLGRDRSQEWYEKTMYYADGGNIAEAKFYLGELKTKYSGNPLTRKAQQTIDNIEAEALYNKAQTAVLEEKKALAEAYFNRITNQYPETQWAAKASEALDESKFQREIFVKDTRDKLFNQISAAILEAHAQSQYDEACKDRDEGNRDRAIKRLEAIILMYEGSKVSQNAQDALDELQSPQASTGAVQ